MQVSDNMFWQTAVHTNLKSLKQPYPFINSKCLRKFLMMGIDSRKNYIPSTSFIL